MTGGGRKLHWWSTEHGSARSFAVAEAYPCDVRVCSDIATLRRRFVLRPRSCSAIVLTLALLRARNRTVHDTNTTGGYFQTCTWKPGLGMTNYRIGIEPHRIWSEHVDLEMTVYGPIEIHSHLKMSAFRSHKHTITLRFNRPRGGRFFGTNLYSWPYPTHEPRSWP